jgi:hypothetical protein
MRNGDHFFPTSDACHSSDTIGRLGRIFEDWKVCPPILPDLGFPVANLQGYLEKVTLPLSHL